MIYSSCAVSVTFFVVMIEKYLRDLMRVLGNSLSTINFFRQRGRYVHSHDSQIQHHHRCHLKRMKQVKRHPSIHHSLNWSFCLPLTGYLRIRIALQINDQSLLRTHHPNPCHFGHHCRQKMKTKTNHHQGPGADIPACLYGPTHLQNIVVGRYHPSLKQSERVLRHPMVHRTFEWINGLRVCR